VLGFQQFATSYTGAVAFVSIAFMSVVLLVMLRRAAIGR
jgi:hypothetical protein